MKLLGDIYVDFSTWAKYYINMQKKIPDAEIILYALPQSTLSIEVVYANENVWLSKKK